MVGQSFSHAGDLGHQIVTDAPTLQFFGVVGTERDGGTKVYFFQTGGHVHGNELQGGVGTALVKPGNIHKPLLELVDDVVVRLVVFGEDYNFSTVCQCADRLAECI